MKNRIIIAILIAAGLWFFMFSPWTAGIMNFWFAMSISASVLWLLSIFLGENFSKQFRFSSREIVLGLLSAVVLYGVFYLGNYLSTAWFDFAKPQIGNIYSMKDGSNLYLVGTLLLVLIGPAEEIFWRGYVQRTLGNKYGDWTAFILTTLVYTLVHIWSFNFMLIMAAMVCGAFWGLMFMFNKKNLVSLVISHAVWDLSVFILFPIS
ncbi:MAG: type II CAAX endopeptidase family protein [Paludibacter sp.]|nr:type II CAAX endopeptidase family protein [Paludibacter sp.]